MSAPPEYAFGDSDTAARRLALVAALFDPPSRAFLASAAPVSPALAIDLGCGPGHTTRLLHETTGASRTVGLDTSDAFLGLAAAAASAEPGISFQAHDVRDVPFPAGPADLIYARLLLAHLRQPATVATRWATQLKPGGTLLLDEVEFIRTTDPVLARYEEMVVALVAARGALMYAGPELAGLGRSEVVVVEVAPAAAAAMFGLNLTTWRHDPAIAARWRPSEIDDLAGGLADLEQSPATSGITWGLRQMAITS